MIQITIKIHLTNIKNNQKQSVFNRLQLLDREFIPWIWKLLEHQSIKIKYIYENVVVYLCLDSW
ncbi:MAG: hypothetical protein AN490_07885 [Anabaena sp. AL09]|nr:MAG: hypothetical protein AN490_07885 [Anabaena sp. AL09]